MPAVDVQSQPNQLEYDNINYNIDALSNSDSHHDITHDHRPLRRMTDKPQRDSGSCDRGQSASEGTSKMSQRKRTRSKSRGSSAAAAVNQSAASSGHPHNGNRRRSSARSPASGDESNYSDDFDSEEDRRSPPSNRKKPPPSNNRQRQQKTKNIYKTTMKKSRANTGSFGSSLSSVKENGTDPTLRRMVSAKQHRISQLENKLGELTIDLDRFFEENRSLRRIQNRQSRALEKYDGKTAELPQLLKQNADEVRTLRHQLRKKQKSLEEAERAYQDLNDQYNETKDRLEHFRQLNADKKLKEREQLMKELDESTDNLADKDKKIKDLERQLQLMQKNHKREINEIHFKHKDTFRDVDALKNEIAALEEKVKEKDKEIGMRNIYSHRLIKPPSRLSPKRDPSPVRHSTKGTMNGNHDNDKIHEQSKKILMEPLDETPSMKPFEEPEPEPEPEPVKPAEEEPPPVAAKPPIKPVPKKEKDEKLSDELDEDTSMLEQLQAQKARRDRKEEERIRKLERQRQDEEEERKRDELRMKMEHDEQLRILAELDRERDERLRQEEESREKAEREKVEEEEREKERLAKVEREKDVEDAETKQRKIELLEKLREIDEQHGTGSNFDSRSRKQYNFRKPDENLHNGKPSHDDVSVPASLSRRGSKANNPETPVAFGGYQPTLSNNDRKKNSDRKASLLRDLFGEDAVRSGGAENAGAGAGNEPNPDQSQKRSFSREKQQPNKVPASPISDRVVDDDIEELTL